MLGVHPTARSASGSVAIPRPSPTRARRSAVGHLVEGDRATFRRRSSRRLDRPAAAGGDAALRRASGRRLSSRTSPSNDGVRTAARNTALTTESARSSGSSGAARTAASIATVSCVAASTYTASTSSSLLANQYSTVCLRTPTAAAISSSETASTPRVPNSSTDASRILVLVGAGAACHSVYHLVENHARPVVRDRRVARRQAHRHHGATGFVGTALVERLLRCVPDCNLILLVRDGKRTTAAQRVERELLRNDAFDHLRNEHGRGFGS